MVEVVLLLEVAEVVAVDVVKKILLLENFYFFQKIFIKKS